jgi:hypothetical protein
MSAEMTKTWQPATPHVLAAVPCVTGVYQIRRTAGPVLDIGYAGARETFGLRSKLRAVVDELAGDDLELRFESHVQYQSRYVELVLLHRARHHGDPPAVAQRAISVVGGMSPG